VERALSAGVGLRAEEAKQFLQLTAGDAANQAALATTVLAQRPDYAPALMALAAAEVQRGDRAAAQQRYADVLAAYPQLTVAQRQFVVLAAAQPEGPRETLDVALRAREAFPNDAELAKAVAIHLFRQNEFARSIPLLEQAARDRAQDAEVFYYLGAAQRQANRNAAAKTSLQRALELQLPAALAAEAQKALAGME
jgi:cellulose synthase operon protein C